MTYIKIEGIEYPAAVSGRFQDRDWNGRESKAGYHTKCNTHKKRDNMQAKV